MSNSVSGVIPALGELRIDLSSLETAVFEVLHLDPNVYFRTLRQSRDPLTKSLSQKQKDSTNQIYSSSASGFWFGPFPSILVVARSTVA